MFPVQMSNLSHDQVRLVLRRAAELEKRRDVTPGTVGETEVAEIAAEVGIAPDAVRDALAELRAGSLAREAPAEPTFLDHLLGPGEVVVTRTVRGPAAQVQLAIADFMRAQLLEVKRNLGERGQIWAPAADLWSRLRRTFSFSQEVVFQKGAEIVVAVVPQADDQVLVRIAARFVDPRKERAWGLAAGTVAGAGLAVGGVALFGPAALDAAAVAAGLITAGGTYFGVRHSQRKDLDRAEQALLRLLDALEYERY